MYTIQQNQTKINVPKHPDMGRAALWYAKQGYYVFPLHTPIFNDAGKCVGCTCEEWKRTQPRYRADYKCDQPGKCPRVKWAIQSTIDPEIIEKWWGWWPDANIGIDMAKSGILALDLDSYKDTYAGDDLHIEARTVTAFTGGGGKHLWYAMPQGCTYGNATGNLPKGIDVRGAGGYVVAAPSLHQSGRRYAFADGLSIVDLIPAPLSQSLIDLLEAAQTSRQSAQVIFSHEAMPMPDLAKWELSAAILKLIHNGKPKGERSEADYSVILALVRAGASDDDIRAVFTHYAIGAKYDEKGDRYLTHSIGNARAIVGDTSPQIPRQKLVAAREHIRSAVFVQFLRAEGAKGGVAVLIKCLDALLETASKQHTSKVTLSIRDLADLYVVSKSSTDRHVKTLEEMQLIGVKPGKYGTQFDLSPLLQTLDESGTVSKKCVGVPLSSSVETDFFTEHRQDDAFTSYPYAYAIKRREMPTVLMQSLGQNGLLLWEALEKGGTKKELAEMTGLSVYCVQRTLKKFERAGLLVTYLGYEHSYELHPDAEYRLEERREHMVTAGIGQLRAARHASDKASYAQRQLQGRMHLEAREKAKLAIRRDTADMKATAMYDSLARMGIDAFAKVAHRTPRPNTVRFDAVEEWRTWGRDMWEAVQSLGEEMDLQSKKRLLTIAEVGEDTSAEIYRTVHKEVSERIDIALRLAPRQVT